jgi:hypothetical protein
MNGNSPTPRSLYSLSVPTNYVPGLQQQKMSHATNKKPNTTHQHCPKPEWYGFTTITILARNNERQ